MGESTNRCYKYILTVIQLKFIKLNLFKIASASFLALLVLQVAISIALPTRAFADNYNPEDRAAAWNIGLALSNCSNDAGWINSDLLGDQSADDINNGDIFPFSTDVRDAKGDPKTVGYLVDPKEDGTIKCQTPKDIVSMFRRIDETPLNFLKSVGIYKINASKTAYEVGLSSNSARASAIRNAIEKKFGFNYNQPMPKDMQYATLKASFLARCRESTDPDGTPVHIVDDTGKLTITGYVLKNGNDRVVQVGYSLEGDGGNDQKMSCPTIVRQMKTTSAAYILKVKVNIDDDDPNNDPNSGNTGSGDNDGNEDSCESQSGSTAWIMCPAINIVGGALNWVDVQLTRLMEIDNNKYSTADGDNALYSAWSKFRNIGLTLLIAAMLVMVISTALGVGALDAYTVKKAFPRMVVSVLFMMLSWYVCVFLIDVSNVVGRGTLGLMTSPFGTSASSLSSLFSTTSGADIAGGSVVSLGGLAILGSAFAIPGAAAILFSWLGSGLLIMLIAFLTLIARQMFVLVLILGSPIAILSWIFPGNDKLWKLWWSSFSKLLLMFPMVMALIASGRIFAGATNSITDVSTGESLLNVIIKFTAYVVPYAFIPLTFKAAGGVFGNLVGMANDRSKGAFDRLKKGREKTKGEIGQRMGAGEGFRGNNKFSKGLNAVSSGAASGPRGWVGGKRGRAGIREAKRMHLGEESAKNSPLYDKTDDMLMMSIADEQLARDKIADNEARVAQARATGDADGEVKAAAELSARKQALATARAMPNRGAALRRQAGLDLAASGYQFDYGTEGLDQLHTMADRIYGEGDSAEKGKFLNSAQYNLKGAGRSDLGGLNYGAGGGREQVRSGIVKLGNGARGQGKTDTYIGGADGFMGPGVVDQATGKTMDDSDAMAAQIISNIENGDVTDENVGKWHDILVNDRLYASDANKAEIDKQLAALNIVANTAPDVVTTDPNTGASVTAPNPVRVRIFENNTRVARTALNDPNNPQTPSP